ncbi:MAG: YqgE/AlgH family protein [Woeseia sp.]|nr:YqgE/AlgH family protein [Woeseia sp.]|tara:strand:+ start:606 stop:1169 length:564 start_codon:yes stop_codon:yes gene_type:complete
MNLKNSLCNQLLIAMPGMADPNFNSTVTLICEHNSEGALGIIINRPIEMKLGGLFEQLNLAPSNQLVVHNPVLSGGPVAQERGFVLHSPIGKFESSVTVSADVQLTVSRDVIGAIAAGKGPDKVLVALGYAGWESGQLEAEMLANTWLSVPASPDVIFDVPYADRWNIAAQTIGINISQISADAGHA